MRSLRVELVGVVVHIFDPDKPTRKSQVWVSDLRETLERRFAGRAGAVEASDGFEWFELLRPVEGTDQYLVYTRWRSEEDFQKWHVSQDFARGHAGGAEGVAPPRPAAHASQVWSFEVLQHAGPKKEA